MLIVTDVYSNIQRLMRILKAIDITGIGQEISVVPLEFSDATKLVTLLKSVFQTSQKPKKGGTPKVFQFVADERTNTIVLLASEVDTARVKGLIRLLDKQVPRGKEKIHVYYLEHATAEDLAKVLQALPTKPAVAAKGPKESPIVSEEVKITPDKATNSLIIMAEKDDYLVLEEIIEKLDIPRTMVYIECLIMEVDVDKDFNVGTEWTAMTEISYQGREGGAGGGYSGADPGYSNISGVAAGTLPAGFSLGVFTEALQIGGVQFPNLAAIVQAYQKDKDVHILSTPQILTTDNEEATIIVAKNVPYQTRSAAETGVETYSSFEYKDVGITLKITPQISEERLVRLDIYQEISKLDDLATTNPDRPTTLKRTIETTVIVKDGRTIVIGGLIEDAFTARDYKTPCLGDIPILGWLFRSYSKATEKTNLFVFLTPKVVKRPAEAETINREKKELIDKIKEGQIKMYE
jgi:general secretion pathway protein D